METDMKFMQMEINIKGNILMDYQKDMDNIAGEMDHGIKEILNKELEMDMEFGKIKKTLVKYTRDTICLIKSMDMEYTIGATDMFIKDILWMTYALEKDNYY